MTGREHGRIASYDRGEWEYQDDDDDGDHEATVAVRGDWPHEVEYFGEEREPDDVAYISAAEVYKRSRNASRELRRMPYAQYLKTRHWRTTRRRAQLRAGGQCQRCYATNQRLEVHHLTYERLGRESEADLIVLCFECHRMEHPEKALSPDAVLVLRKLKFIGASPEQIAEILADADKVTWLAARFREAA